MKGIALLILLVLVGGFAVLTKPTVEELEKQFYDSSLKDLKEKITINDNDDLLSSVGKLACQVSPEDCTKIILKQANFTIVSNDLVALQTAKIEMNGETKGNCVGAFKTWKCF